MLFLFVFCFLVKPIQSIEDDKKFTALKFGTSINDYVQFSNFDMSPFRNALSICSWMKRVYTGSGTSAVVMHYHTSSQYLEILISSTGQYNIVFDSRVVENLNSKFTTPVGEWMHYCLCWSFSTKTIQVYLNGVLVASGQERSGRQLHTSGTLTFGRVFPSTNTAYIFGGEIFDLNFYTEVLSPDVISRMAGRAVCEGAGGYLEERYRAFRWEQLLEQSRSGFVTEVNLLDTCTVIPREYLDRQINITSETQVDLNQTRKDLATVRARLNRAMAELETTQQDLETVTSSLNRTEEVLSEKESQLNQTQNELKQTQNELKQTQSELNQTQNELNQTSEQQEMCSSKLEEARKFENISRFDVLFTTPYYNKIFTEGLLQQLQSSWDIMSDFVGVNLTEAVVDHFRKHDGDQSKECGEPSAKSIIDMFGELINVKMTWGIIRHFKDSHSGNPCDEENRESDIDYS